MAEHYIIDGKEHVYESAAEKHLTDKTITENGTYNAEDEGNGINGYKEVSVNVESGSNTFAFVDVIYNVGATCSMSNGDITLTAEDTSGEYIFAIPTPAETPETWTIIVNNGIETETKDIQISEYGQRSTYTVMIDSIEFLKSNMANTEYTMLSIASGDGANEGGRWFERTSGDPPLIFVDFYYLSGYKGYGVISISSDLGNYTNNSYGKLIQITKASTTLGMEYYIFTMDGAFQGMFPTYTVDGETISRGSRTSYAYAYDYGINGDAKYVEELESFIDRLARIMAKNS